MITWTKNGLVTSAQSRGFKMVAWSSRVTGTGWLVRAENGEIVGLSWFGISLDKSQRSAEAFVDRRCGANQVCVGQ